MDAECGNRIINVAKHSAKHVAVASQTANPVVSSAEFLRTASRFALPKFMTGKPWHGFQPLSARSDWLPAFWTRRRILSHAEDGEEQSPEILRKLEDLQQAHIAGQQIPKE